MLGDGLARKPPRVLAWILLIVGRERHGVSQRLDHPVVTPSCHYVKLRPVSSFRSKALNSIFLHIAMEYRTLSEQGYYSG